MCHCGHHKAQRELREIVNCVIIVEYYLAGVDPR
jgi:hypothetical protein